MFEKLKAILRKSKEDMVDLSIAHAKVRNDARLAGEEDLTDIYWAYMLIQSYESLVTKLWRENELEALKELCEIYKYDDKKAMLEFVGKWQ